VSIRLSANFTLNEMVRSNTATAKGINNKPSIQHIVNATAHAALILQPLRIRVGKPVMITSWYRCPELNAAVGGSKTSTHMTGAATDIRIAGMTPEQIIDVAKELNLPTDQIINEGFYRGQEWISWTHIASPKDLTLAPRGEVLMARGDRTNPTYTAIA